MSELPGAAEHVLRHGVLCHLSAPSPAGPHVTPVVYVLHGGRLWGTTARGTAKARAWRRDRRAAGLVRFGTLAVTFRGSVATYDALDPGTWRAAVRDAAAVARASVGFTLKNAPFFAGYAVDARRVPLSWSPPGRVFFSVDLEAGAVVDLGGGTVSERWGQWEGRADRVPSRSAFRPSPARLPDGGVPSEVRRAVGRSGEGALGISGSGGTSVLPVAWVRAPADGAYYAVLHRSVLALARAEQGAAAGLAVDRASVWRASDMAGILLRGPVDLYVPGRLRSGKASLLERVRRAEALPDDPAVVRMRPDAAVWWRGWSSGTVRRR